MCLEHAGFGGVLVVAAGGYLLQVAGKSSGAPTIRAVNSVATLVTPLEEPLLLSSSTSMTSLVKSPHPVTKLPKEGKAAAPATTAEAGVLCAHVSCSIGQARDKGRSDVHLSDGRYERRLHRGSSGSEHRTCADVPQPARLQQLHSRCVDQIGAKKLVASRLADQRDLGRGAGRRLQR